eukprot:TRINITY_DN5201_c0_g1_i4.p2 TRINITY_DN5201_c0_g1~~TRINITY_DN5201_c0_g1_i4.p2  ORF type:complete len:121 (+),score=21.49 TRINITY_DN5201_c0_g1_i4:74-436(+)
MAGRVSLHAQVILLLLATLAVLPAACVIVAAREAAEAEQQPIPLEWNDVVLVDNFEQASTPQTTNGYLTLSGMVHGKAAGWLTYRTGGLEGNMTWPAGSVYGGNVYHQQHSYPCCVPKIL